MKKVLAVLSVAGLTSVAMADVDVDLTGVESRYGLGDGGNQVILVNTGIPNVEITGIEWDLFFTPNSPSWTDEPNWDFSNGGHNWDMGDHGGTSNSNPIALIGSEVTSFFADGAGIVRIEFWEDFDDGGVDPDGVYNQGTLTLKFIPAPASAALLGLGGLVATRRRR